jgi:uncharacterized membrane protein
MAIAAGPPMSRLPQRASRSLRNLGERADRDTINRSLGWFSLALGLTQLLAPRAVGRAIGVGERPVAMRLCGAREILSGVGLLSGRAPAAFAMSRLIGDALDLALLGASLGSPRADRNRIAAAATAVVGVTAVDLYASKLDVEESRRQARHDQPVTVSLVINAPPERLYEFWRKLDNLPRFMKHLQSIEVLDERVSRWVAIAPGGARVQWESEIIDDRPNELISWRTRPGSQVSHRGSIRFAPTSGGRGTLVRVEVIHGAARDAANGGLRARVTKLLGGTPEAVMREDLRRFKQLIETGEVPTTRGQPSGSRSFIGQTFSRTVHQEAE